MLRHYKFWPGLLGIVACCAGQAPTTPVSRPPIVGVAHIGLETNDMTAARQFYGHELGFADFSLDKPTGGLMLTYFKVNDHQYIEVFPDLKTETQDRLSHIAFETTNAQQLRDYLASRNAKVPETLKPGLDGNLSFTIKDADGHTIEFVQYMPGSVHSNNFGKLTPETRLSTHIIHVGFTVQDRAAADALFKDILGFQLMWSGGKNDTVADWVDMRVPEGTDWLEYMLNVHNPSPKTLGVMNHLALGVPNVQPAYQGVLARGLAPTAPPKIGRDGKWQLNLYDPNLTRSEFMEFEPVETPCCSPMLKPPFVNLTSQEDQRRLLNMLHIESLRSGADGRNPQAPNAANYDESKANPYPGLPDPLVRKDGSKITTAAQWQQRRAEIMEDFDHEVYGRVPKNTPAVKWEVVKTSNERNGDVPVVTKQLVGHVDSSAYPALSVDIQLSLTTPVKAAGPVPVIMEFGYTGPRPPAARAALPSGPTWQQQVLAKGWGYAVLAPTSVQADNGAGLTQGIIGLMNQGQPRKLDDWGALRAWAWGASRALDYFETDKSVDARRVGIEGHSRYGKATLVTMAYDPRFAIAYVSSSGKGGAELYRRSWGELVENVAATQEYHWMAGNFLKYAGPLNASNLPVDSHELIALCAPRPVFVSGGATEGDGWVDAKGMFMATAAAGPVYRLVGKRDMGTNEFPTIETPLIDGDIAFRQHSGGHTPAPNWPTFLTFADRYFKP